MNASHRFPDSFLWGASTSAYQIEGSPLADGAGPSIWQRFAHSPGRTVNGDSGDVACDHYRRFADDVALMGELGLQAYRFSIAWSRILPEGTGKVNRAGLGFYERLVDALLAAGITPNATLFHWDLPAALDDRGGWLNRDVADWFGDYARVVFAALGDRVPMWATLNEPWVVTDGGYLHGALAPGHKNLFEAPIASHNLMRAHGMGVQAFRAESRAGQVGLVVNLEPKDPATDSAEDARAAQRGDAYMNRQYLDPVFKGSYPDEMRDIFGAAWPDFPATDFALIGQPIDFLGINYYTRGVVRDDPTALPVRIAYVRQPEHAYTETGWEVHPPSLTRTLLWVTERYGRIPLYVTENGAAFYDAPHAIDGAVNDPLRVWYYREHLKACREAIAHGADLRGYFAWSLLDNYEWSLGFSKRFGIVHVNYATQERTPKASALYYRDVIRSNGESLGG
ncbi:MAG TPA: GH1 family beta-glucosidase [Gemmatimonadaceae bacterium]|nr:GH1 family beta-glucosidase [Gemmatimonadaceae bacterium]